MGRAPKSSPQWGWAPDGELRGAGAPTQSQVACLAAASKSGTENSRGEGGMESRFQATLHPHPQPTPQVDLLCPPPCPVPCSVP